MSTIIPADFPSEEEDKAKAQARAQYTSITAMVAAMKCDYDRLEELRDEKEGATRYVAGWNMPGYNPDDVATFDNAIDAMHHIQGAALDVYFDDDEISAEQLDAIRAEIDTWKADENGEFGHTYRKYHYFVIQQTNDDVFTAEDAEELAELEEAAGEYEDQDAARHAIQEDPLSVEVRSGWETPGAELKAAEFQILLCTGGPAVRIMGELNEYGEPCRAWLEYQDWGAPWTQYHEASQETLLDYARVFYFGEG